MDEKPDTLDDGAEPDLGDVSEADVADDGGVCGNESVHIDLWAFVIDFHNVSGP